MSAETVGKCHACGAELTALDYGRRDSCPGCGRDTRICLHCHFFDESLYNQCREPQAERVLDKERANSCDYFKPATPLALGGKKREVDEAKTAFEALFRS